MQAINSMENPAKPPTAWPGKVHRRAPIDSYLQQGRQGPAKTDPSDSQRWPASLPLQPQAKSFSDAAFGPSARARRMTKRVRKQHKFRHGCSLLFAAKKLEADICLLNLLIERMRRKVEAGAGKRCHYQEKATMRLECNHQTLFWHSFKQVVRLGDLYYKDAQPRLVNLHGRLNTMYHILFDWPKHDIVPDQ
jgi:hypothetical protein